MQLGLLPKHQEPHLQVQDGHDGDFPYSELTSRLILTSLALCFGPVPRHKADGADRLQQQQQQQEEEEEEEGEEGEEVKVVEEEKEEEGEGSNKIT